MEKRPEVFRPPTPVPGLDLRTWLAGCAVCNPNVVTSADPDIAASQAIEVADKLLMALKAPPPVSPENAAPPSEEAMKRWDESIKKQSNRNEKVTSPAMKRKSTKASRQTSPTKSPGRYSVTLDEEK